MGSSTNIALQLRCILLELSRILQILLCKLKIPAAGDANSWDVIPIIALTLEKFPSRKRALGSSVTNLS